MLPKTDTVGSVLARLGIDLQGPFPITKAGNKYILVVQDYCSRFVEMFGLPDKHAMTIAKKIDNEIFWRYGGARRLHSDQGKEFINQLMINLCHRWGVEKTNTSPYRPQSNGLVERSNKSIKTILRQACKGVQEWDDLLPKIRGCLNATIHRSTGVTPFKMFFSRCEEPRLPLDLLTNRDSEPPDISGGLDYVIQQRKVCQRIAEIVRIKLF